ncbi:MAG TPA: hypothetical protein VFU81_18635, partial [Thermomicrobiales bacterium]|nr:hypothetical protein [Thermomicrobiales bacterium]
MPTSVSFGTGVPARGRRPSDGSRLRGLIPPLTVGLCLATAVALLLTAATLAPPATSAPALLPPAAPTATASPGATTALLGRVEDVPAPPAPVMLGLARLLYPPGSGGLSRSLPGPLLLVVEAGSLAADVGGEAQIVRADGAAEIATGNLTLHSGDGIHVPSGDAAAFQNRGTNPAVVLAAGAFAYTVTPDPTAHSLDPRTGTMRWLDAWSPGASVQPIAGGWLADPPSTPMTLVLRRLNLAPGSQLPLPMSDGMVVGVEAGVLTVAMTQGLAWRQPPY